MLKPELQAKFLSHLSNRKKKEDEGFTLIELLVVVIIIGVLAAIALPSLLGQVNKAKQAEPKNNIGTINRAQQAFYLEYQKFAANMSELQVGVKSQTENYLYTVALDGALGVGYSFTFKDALKSYYGAVGTITGDTATKESLTVAIACETTAPFSVANGAAMITAVATPTATTCITDFTSLAR
ncbi:prepilin-type N-terminal cleavage/methylation domain-containing protein [Anabaena minutissima FACHB-250]|nr:prepilin-type N-terminal cleavage/methylation domain-containing protein [Anabaena minutissima FACHB-250]